MKIQKDETNAGYQDADMQKLGILEDIGLGDPNAPTDNMDGGGTPTGEALPDADQSMMDAIETTPTEDPASTSTDTPVEGEAPVDTPVEGDTPTDGGELTDDELDSFLKELTVADEAIQDASVKTDEAVSTGDNSAILQSLDEERKARLEQDRIIERLTMQLKIEKEGSDRILEDKFLVETDLKEKSKLADIVTSDDSLKQLVVLKSRAETDPVMKDRYVNVLRDMYESASGLPIKDMMDSMKQQEKSGMSAGGSYTYEGDNPTESIASGMLERI